MNWLEQFTANYEGKSNEARELQPYMKENYKGNAYIPWATMERLTYMQDPDAMFVTHVDTDGSPLFSRKMTLDTVAKETTHSEFYTHFVRVGVTFLGKTIIEDYPVQDKAYDAPKVVDSNLVNKAIQRAKAKVASRVTGLALKLYESKDLQFDEPEVIVKAPVAKPVAPVPPIPDGATVIVTNAAVETAKGTPVSSIGVGKTMNLPISIESTYGQFIINNWAKLESVFPTYNGALQKKYGWQFVSGMSADEINQKMNTLPNPAYMFEQMKKKAGL